MSSMYIVEPPTSGKVVLSTDCGDIDVELWCKEAPKACRNFIQLCQEGYYDGTIFHRVIKGFMVQGGDPTGSGEGGESIYGRTFKDEFHQRLKFTHRGQVAMANGGPNDNASQFFITLDKCEHLNRKNTIFGKVTGNTIFNVLQMAEREVDEDDRPEEPIRIRKTETLSCPFDDILPRETKPKIDPSAENESKKRKRKVKATKNFKLISFGDEAEEDEVETEQGHAAVGTIKSAFDDNGAAPRKRSKSDKTSATESAHADNTEPDGHKKNSSVAHEEQLVASMSSAKKLARIDGDDNDDYDSMMRASILSKKKDNPLKSPAAVVEKQEPTLSTRADRIEASRQEARRLQESLRADRQKSESKNAPVTEAPSARSDAQRFLDEQAQRYRAAKNIPRSKEQRQDRTIEMLAKFKSKLSASIATRADDDEEVELESDDDTGWMGHTLKDESYDRFATEGIDPELDPNTLSLEDPRNPMNIRRREASAKKNSRHRDRSSQHDRRHRDHRDGRSSNHGRRY